MISDQMMSFLMKLQTLIGKLHKVKPGSQLYNEYMSNNKLVEFFDGMFEWVRKNPNLSSHNMNEIQNIGTRLLEIIDEPYMDKLLAMDTNPENEQGMEE